jgi:NDP-sugar pyrophosphorylase family protein
MGAILTCFRALNRAVFSRNSLLSRFFLASPGDARCDMYVLAGGLGTRIRSVLGDVPKLLAPIGGEPYLEYLFARARAHGLKRIVLGLGHGADAVCRYLEANPPRDLIVQPVIETQPLGTAGALRLARPFLGSDPVLAMNGDAIVECDLDGFIRQHRAKGALATLLVAWAADASAFGRLVMEDDMIVRFVEKDAADHSPGWVNAGMYLIGERLLDEIAAGTARSLEYEVFGRLAPRLLAGFRARGSLIDIGTPESLALARAATKNSSEG